MILAIQAVTITVSNLEKSKQFYEEILGFEPDSYYEPTRWQCYHSEGRAYLGISEVSNYQKKESDDIINFDIENIEEFWEKIKEYVDVETELGKTSWGSYKFVIRDPDGNRLGFAEKK